MNEITDRKNALMSLAASIKREQMRTAEGWSPAIDKANVTVLDLLRDMETHVSEIHGQLDEVKKIEDLDIRDNVIELWRLISMVSAKLGMPASFFDRPSQN